jgi:hypothetical protein
MRKIITPAIVALSLAITPVAFAAEMNHSLTGTIKALDAKACTVTIGTRVIHFAEKCDFAKFKVGERVKLTWHLHSEDIGTAISAVG